MTLDGRCKDGGWLAFFAVGFKLKMTDYINATMCEKKYIICCNCKNDMLPLGFEPRRTIVHWILSPTP